MKRIKMHYRHGNKTDLADDDRRSSSPSILFTPSDNSNPLISSVVSSMCELSKNVNNCLLTNDNQSITNTNEKRGLIGNISSCKICHKLDSSNQYDTCLRCRENQLDTRSDPLLLSPTSQNSNSQIGRSHSLYVGNAYNKDDKLRIGDENKHKLNRENSTRSLSLHPPSIDSLSHSSCLYQILLQPKFSPQTTVIETKKCPLFSPAPPPTPPPVLNIPPERIIRCKQRQIELDRIANKLLENLLIKSNENINQISKYWSYLKQLSLDQFQPKTHRCKLVSYLLKSSYLNKQYELYLEENDELKAALQVLLTVLTIVREKYSFSTIYHLFDYEEKITLENLRHQLEFLHSSYIDELSFIHSRIDFYQSCTTGEKNFDWIQIIKVDYPILIEKICDDFILKVPQIEQILIQMLRDMKRRLLSMEINNRLTLR